MVANFDIIYCIGDSHVNFLSGNSIMQDEWPKPHMDRVPIFKTYRLGPHLAFSVANPESKASKKLFSLLKRIPKGSRILLSYGEIDCRVHLIKQSEKQRRMLKDIVYECVDKYFSVVRKIKSMGYNLIVFNLIPSTAFNIPYQEFPTYGSCLSRNKVTAIFNERLSYWAKKYNLPQISLFEKLILPTGLTDMRYYADPIHLSVTALPMVINEIDKKIPGVNKELLRRRYKINYVEYVYYCLFRKYINFAYIMLRNL